MEKLSFRAFFCTCIAMIFLPAAGRCGQENMTLGNSRYRLVRNGVGNTLRLEVPGFVEIPEIALAVETMSAEPIELQHPVWGKGNGLKAVQGNVRFTERMGAYG